MISGSPVTVWPAEARAPQRKSLCLAELQKRALSGELSLATALAMTGSSQCPLHSGLGKAHSDPAAFSEPVVEMVVTNGGHCYRRVLSGMQSLTDRHTAMLGWEWGSALETLLSMHEAQS